MSAKSLSETFPIAWSNSRSLIERSTSVFSRSSAARVRPPKICGPAGSSIVDNGANMRHAAAPTAAAPKMIRLRRMMPAGVCPSDRNTTMVAPTRPARVKNCQGCSGCESVEVAELIVQARVDGWIKTRIPRGCDRGRDGPTARRPHDGDQADDTDDVRERPGHAIEAAIDGGGEHRLTAEDLDERRDDRIVVLPFR